MAVIENLDTHQMTSSEQAAASWGAHRRAGLRWPACSVREFERRCLFLLLKALRSEAHAYLW